MAEEAPAAKRLTRAGSFSGVWWKLGDAAVDPSAAERRLRSIADEEADLRARVARRHDAARRARRRIVFASLAVEAVAFIHAYWRRRAAAAAAAGWSKKLLLVLLAPPLLAVPAAAAIVFAAFARFQKMFDARDQQRLETLVAERKAKIGQFRGSHLNMQKLLEKYDPDAAAAAAETASSSDHPVHAPASTRIKRTHSRLSFHIGDD